jgi:hypothetical protein
MSEVRNDEPACLALWYTLFMICKSKTTTDRITPYIQVMYFSIALSSATVALCTRRSFEEWESEMTV